MKNCECPDIETFLYCLFLFFINVVGPLFLTLLLLDIGSDKVNLSITSGGFVAAFIIDAAAISICLEDRKKKETMKPSVAKEEQKRQGEVKEKRETKEENEENETKSYNDPVRWWSTPEDQFVLGCP